MLSRPPKAYLVVVDDDPHVLSALRFAFETEGYQVRTCGSGEELLARPPYDPHTCLIVDERLPGMSGLDAIAQLRRLGVRAPAILITTHPSLPVRHRAAAADVDIVEKPLLDATLGQKVRAALAC
jgi:two-component system response regulator FixJ